MLSELQIGAEVEHNGQPIGSVERVLDDHVLVRHGRADYLLKVPETMLIVQSAQRASIANTVKLDEVERTAIDSGRAPPTGNNLEDAGRTDPSPPAEGLIGVSHGMPRSYDGPSTG